MFTGSLFDKRIFTESLLTWKCSLGFSCWHLTWHESSMGETSAILLGFFLQNPSEPVAVMTRVCCEGWRGWVIKVLVVALVRESSKILKQSTQLVPHSITIPPYYLSCQTRTEAWVSLSALAGQLFNWSLKFTSHVYSQNGWDVKPPLQVSEWVTLVRSISSHQHSHHQPSD